MITLLELWTTTMTAFTVLAAILVFGSDSDGKK